MPDDQPVSNGSRPTTADGGSSSKNDPLIGREYGIYRIVRRLGSGGMGVVYEALDTRLSRTVAIKMLADELTDNDDTLRRFENEARATARLNHPNVVTIHEFGHAENHRFLVMELMPGGSVQDHLRNHGSLSWEKATAIIAGACRGLAVAHEAGLIHRDIKPANLLLSADGTVKLGDFGLARSVHRSNSGITSTGHVLGTPAFMSPEQCRAEMLEPRSDLYSLGATYYHLLTSRFPYPVGDPMQVMFSHCSAPVPDPRHVNKDIPDECAAIVMKAMAKKRGDRHADAMTMLAELEQILSATLALSAAVQTPVPRLVKPTIPPVPVGDDSPSLTITDRRMPIISEKPPARRRFFMIGGSSVGIILLAGIGYVVTRGKGKSEGTQEEQKPVPPDPVPPVVTAQNPGKALTVVRRKSLPGHSGEIRTVRFSPDGKLLATAGEDLHVRLWKMPEGTEHYVLNGHKGRAYCAAFAPDNRTVATGDDQGIRFWGATSGEQLRNVSGLGAIFDVAFSHDGNQLAAAKGYAGLVVWTRNGRVGLNPLHNASLGNQLAVAIEYTADDRSIDIVTFQGAIHRFDAITGKEVDSVRRLRGIRISTSYGPHGELVAFGTGRGPMLWKPLTKEPPVSLASGIGEMNAVAFSPDGGTLAYGPGSDGSFWLRHLATKQETRHRTDNFLRSVAFSPDGKTLVTGGGHEGEVILWDVREAD